MMVAASNKAKGCDSCVLEDDTPIKRMVDKVINMTRIGMSLDYSEGQSITRRRLLPIDHTK